MYEGDNDIGGHAGPEHRVKVPAFLAGKIDKAENKLGGNFFTERGWIVFVFKVEKEANYKINARIKYFRKKLAVAVEIDDQINEIYQAEKSGQNGPPKYMQHTLVNNVHLDRGLHKIKLKPIVAGWGLDWIEVVDH